MSTRSNSIHLVIQYGIFGLSLSACSIKPPADTIKTPDISTYRATNLSELIYFMSEIPSGRKLCDTIRGKKQEKIFRRLYSTRITDLLDSYYRKHHRPRDIVHTSTCLSGITDQELEKFLKDFDRNLAVLEAKYQ